MVDLFPPILPAEQKQVYVEKAAPGKAEYTKLMNEYKEKTKGQKRKPSESSKKKKKKKVDPTKPKQSMSAYFIFQGKKRGEIKVCRTLLVRHHV